MDNAREQAANLRNLLRREQGAMADLLVALAAFDDRRLWLKLGHTSLFTFLHRELGLSKGASHFRKMAAELIQRFPEVVEPLREGRLCITSIVELAKVMSSENRIEVLPRFLFLEKLDAARDALSHSHPGADVEAILEAGLDLLVERAAKRKGLCTRPRDKKAPSPSLSPRGLGERGESKGARHIPAAVKREVWRRDGGCCRWQLENGELCASTHRLQFDHIEPVARGGASTVENVRLLCAAHNLMAARRVFGDALMDRYALAAPKPQGRHRTFPGKPTRVVTRAGPRTIHPPP